MIPWAVLAYLGVSVVSLTVQVTAFIRILNKHTTVHAARKGLLRTASCRVAASIVYVGLGVAGIFDVVGAGFAAFIALLIIQVMWQVNGVLDARLATRLGDDQ